MDQLKRIIDWCRRPSMMRMHKFQPIGGSGARELLLTVLASLLTCAVVIYVSGPAEQPYEPEVLEISLENATIIKYDPDWARGTWFDWDPANIDGYDCWIIAVPR